MPTWQLFVKGMQGRTYTVDIENSDPEVNVEQSDGFDQR